MKLSDRLNAQLHELMTAYVMRQYDKKSKRVEKKHPELFKAVNVELSEKHSFGAVRVLRAGIVGYACMLISRGLRIILFVPKTSSSRGLSV